MKKTSAEYLKEIEAAIAAVVGPKSIAPEKYLRRDLDVQSLDLVEIFFELKRRTGHDALATHLFAAAGQCGPAADIQVQRLLEIVLATEAASSEQS